MQIRLSQTHEIPIVFKIYNEAIAYQKAVNGKAWKGFEIELVELEIAEKRHYVITEDEEIACTFVLAFTDELIWKEANADAAVYIHRIAVNPKFRGKSYVKTIVTWLKENAEAWKFNFIRLDTESGNERINNYYLRCGFVYKGATKIDWEAGLPAHYKDAELSLFEIEL